MSDCNQSVSFVRQLHELASAPVPSSTKAQAARCLLDYIGSALAGSRMLRDRVLKLHELLLDSRGRAGMVGFDARADMLTAAFINGLCSHVAEMDDGVRFGMMHPGSAVISALLPLVERQGLIGADLVRGIVVGYEAAIRLATAIQPSHRNRGYHATGTCGAIGAAAGAAVAMRLSERQMKNAVSAAAGSTSGMLKLIQDSSELKPFNAATAAQSGLRAALMAAAGFEGPDDVLAGDWGLLAMVSDTCDPSALLTGNHDQFRIEQVYFKPYAACRHCHPAVEAALRIRQETGIQSGKIAGVSVSTYNLACGGHEHTAIRGVNSAKMSTPYSVAVALITGRAGIGEFSEEILQDPALLALARKVLVTEDEDLTALLPNKRPAVLVVETDDGTRYEERVDLAKGEPENPIGMEELQQKFIELAMFGGKSRAYAERIIECVLNVEDDLAQLLIALHGD